MMFVIGAFVSCDISCLGTQFPCTGNVDVAAVEAGIGLTVPSVPTIVCFPEGRKMPPPTGRAVSRAFLASWKVAGLLVGAAEFEGVVEVEEESFRARDDTGVMVSVVADEEDASAGEASSSMILIGMRRLLGWLGCEFPPNGAMGTSIGI